MKAAKELGAARFFPKPLNLDTLEAAVREALTYQQ
jgi:DNA-binding NtrC family response regulator